MPFAMVAVALLLLSSTFCVVYANTENVKENTENITNELSSMDDAIEFAERFMEEGLGKIIYDISADGNGGTIMERAARFDSMKDEWFGSQFPHSENGIAIEILEEDIDMDIQSTKVSSNDILGERSVASYLRASGTVKASFTGTAGLATKTLLINADGTSGLPFIVDCASRFELSTEGDASLLTQLVSYQLSSLAQYRIINGYGLKTVSGGMGTKDIITASDVEYAFRNALDVIETICFRNNSTGDSNLIYNSCIDLADSIILRDGYYEVDIGSIISQALLSITDEVIMRWIDYFGLDRILEFVDRIHDFSTEIVNNIISFLTNNQEDNRNSARIYIKNAMESCGYAPEEYRYVIKDNTRYLQLEAGEFSNEEGFVYRFKGMGGYMDLCETDILAWEGWNNYVVDYERNRNSILDYIRHVFQFVCSSVSSNYGIVRVSADEFDGTTFMDSFLETVNGCLDSCLESLTYDLESSVRNDKISDVLLASIYQTMVDNRQEIFHDDNFKEMFIARNAKSFADYATIGSKDYDLIYSFFYDLLWNNESMDRVCKDYLDRVNEIYEIYDSVMNNPRNVGNSVLKEMIITSGKEIIRQGFVKDRVTSAAKLMMNEIREHIRMNSDCGLLALEGEDRFTLNDGYGNLYEEFAEIADSYRLDISIIDPTRNPGNLHSISAREVKVASYVSVFTVHISGDVDYQARSMSGVDRSLGRYDSEFKGTLDIRMDLDIPCVSAWSLVGAKYEASTNIYKDTWNALLNAVEPMLAPLKVIYNKMKEVFRICSETIIEINSYAVELIDKLYSAIMGPLEMLSEIISDWISRNLCYIVENLCGFVEGFDIGASNQTITFNFCGLLLTVQLRAATLLKTTKNLVKLTLEGDIGSTKFSAFIDLKKNTKNGLMVKCGGGIDNNDCSLDLEFDPEMKFGTKLVRLNGTIRDVDIDACLPYKETYDKFEMCLSDIPGVKEAISNIALPIPGYKCAFDMGVNIKYNLPVGTGLMINEFESNPSGSDNGTEWVELYNATASTINLSGYILVPESNESKAFVITGTSIGPFEKKVIMFEKQSLNNSKSGKHSGESISLYSPDGKKVDSTPWKKDTYNDDRTWQRKADGSNSWAFMKGTPESSNGSIIKTNAFAREFLIDCLLDAADKAFEEMGNHLTSVEEITEYLQRTLELFIKNVIDAIAEIIVSASVFISLELTDYAETQHFGLRAGFEMNSDLVRECIYWLLKQLNILQDVVREPCCNDLDDILCENIYLMTTLYTSISTPKFLAALEEEEMEVGFKAGVNITGISNMIWNEDNGKWKAVLGIVAEDLDATKLPKGLRTDKEKRCDLWLIKVELCKSKSPKSG